MRILITGANGLLGQKLCHLLLKSGDELLATGLGPKRFDVSGSDLSYEILDVTQPVDIDRVFSSWKPDAVIHTAAMTNVDQCENEKEACRLLNVTAVEYLTKACEVNNVRLVYISTDFIFDGLNGPYVEMDIANPVSFYGHSKLDAESIVQSSNGDWSIVRTILVYGVTAGMSRSNIVLWVKKSLEEGKAINVVDDQWRTPTLAEDLAQGCYLAAKYTGSEVFHISGDEMMTPYDVAIHTAEFFGLDKSLISRVNASTFSQVAKRPPKTGFVITKAKEMLGYKPVSFVAGLEVLKGQLEDK